MVKKDPIIFISKYDYLAFSQFFPILLHLGDFQTIYFGLKDPNSYLLDRRSLIQKKEVLTYFDYYYQFDMNDHQNSVNSRRKKDHIHFFHVIRKIITLKRKKIQINHLLNKINPKAVIGTSDLAIIDRIVATWCRKHSTPFIVIQPSFIEGVIAETYPGVDLIRKFLYYIANKLLGVPMFLKQRIYGNEAPWSYLLLWSRHFVLDCNRKNTFFIGNPAFDKLFIEFSRVRPPKKNIVICTENIDDIFGKKLFNQINEIYIKTIKSRPDLTFYIKVHPREPIEKYEKIFNKYNFPNIKILKDYDLYKLYRKCDIQISVNSYSGIEAAAIGLPVITVTPPEIFRNIRDHFQGEINVRVINAEEMHRAIVKILSETYNKLFLQKRERYFKRTMGFVDGQSSKRAADTIRSIILKK